jgi:hypothetical protein
LSGRELKANEFTFDLFDEEGNILQTASNQSQDDGGLIVFENISFDQSTIGKSFYYIVKERIPDDSVAYELKNGNPVKADVNLIYGEASDEQRASYLWGDSSYDADNETGGILYDAEPQMYEIKVHDDNKGSLSFDQKTVMIRDMDWELFELSDDGTETLVEGVNGIHSDEKSLPFLTEDMGLSEGSYRLKEILPEDSVQKQHVIDYDISMEDGFHADIVNGTLPVFENSLVPGKLTISKKVLDGDRNKVFKFKVKLFNPNGEKLNGVFSFEGSDPLMPATISKNRWDEFSRQGMALVVSDISSKEEILAKNGVRRLDDEKTNASIYGWNENGIDYLWTDGDFM